MSEVPPIVHVVDDDDDLRLALVRLLGAAGYETRAHSSAGAFLLAAPWPERGCLLLDLRMPGPDGLELQEALARQECALPVVFLTGHGDVTSSVRAMKAGAVDFLTKPVEREPLLGAIRSALGRNAREVAERNEVRTIRARFDRLSGREKEVFRQVVEGRLNKQIAGSLGTSERTVKAHRAHVMEKMGADSLADLVRKAERLRGL